MKNFRHYTTGRQFVAHVEAHSARKRAEQSAATRHASWVRMTLAFRDLQSWHLV